jgi:hypothetical protein
MPRIVNVLDLTVPAELAWSVVGDLAGAASWIPGVVSARLDGDLRVCTTADGVEIRERISELSAEQRSYRYQHLATPAPVLNSRGSLRVEPVGSGCRVEWLAEFSPADPTHADEITAIMTGAFEQAAQSLRSRIEAVSADIARRSSSAS